MLNRSRCLKFLFESMRQSDKQQIIMPRISNFHIMNSCLWNNPVKKNIDFSKLDPDCFGDLNEKCGIKNQDEKYVRKELKSERLADDPDGYDKLEIKRGIKISLAGYERILDELYRKRPRDLNRMLQVFHEMVYIDRYKPDRHLYTLMINACAQLGYTKKAVELFKEMKRYDYKPTKAMVTALFNACANCTGDKKIGLQNAIFIRDQLKTNGYQFNIKQYNCMIKTFALLNDSENLNATIKEMKNNGIGLNTDSLSMLLMGCISDRDNGLSTASSIMKHLLRTNLKLDISVFNLFLRCIRDCNIQNQQKILQLYEQKNNDSNGNEFLPQERNNQTELIPNLLTGSQTSKILSIDFGSLSLAKNRFLLFGGFEGFLKMLDSRNVKPNLKTFTIIVDLLDVDEMDENEIQKILSRYQLKPDVCLYNVMIKKLAKKNKFSRCQGIIQHMQQNHVRPDIMTFGALTFQCIRTRHAKKLLEEMDQCQIVINNQIMGTLINIACNKKDLFYLQFLLDYIEKNDFKISTMDIEKIHLFLNQIKLETIKLERSNHVESKDSSNPIKNQDPAQLFNEISSQFKQLLKKSNIEVNDNVWSQYERDNNYTSQKTKYHLTTGYLKKKIDLKLNRDHIRKKNEDIDDELD